MSCIRGTQCTRPGVYKDPAGICCFECDIRRNGIKGGTCIGCANEKGGIRKMPCKEKREFEAKRYNVMVNDIVGAIIDE